MDAAPLSPVPGCRLAGYHLRRCLGRGPSGAVYAAVHPLTGHKVAIKLIELHQDSDYGSALWLERVGECLAAWRHPGVIPVLKVGRQEATLYLISEYARGRSLGALLAQSSQLSEANVRPLLASLAAVLAAAHRQGLVHGGLGLENVWLTPREAGSWPPVLRVMDFGLALLRPAETRHHPDPGAFFAPELRAGQTPSPASDSYCWGALAYRLLCGHLPWEAADAEEIWQLQQQGAAIPPSIWAELTPQLEALVLRALDPDPAQRPAAEALVQALAALPAPAPAPVQALSSPPPLSAATPRPEPPVLSAVQLPAGADSVQLLTGSDRRQTRCRPTAKVTRTTGPPAGASSRRSWRPLWAASSALLLAALLLSGGLRLGLGLWPWALAEPVPPPRARLTVTSQPPGATVFVDGQRQSGTTPFTLEGLPQGQPYEVLVHSPGYRPWHQRVALGLGESERVLQATLSKGPPRFGSLVLHLDAEADVFLDGRRVGTQTRQLTLAEVRSGIRHQLRIAAPDQRSLLQTIEVAAGKVKVLHFKLTGEATARR